MADPNEQASGNATAGAVGQGTGVTQAQAEGNQTGVAQQLGQIQALLSSISENVNKVQEATTTDVDSATVSRSSIDPAAGQRRLESYAELALSNAVSFQSAMNALMLRKVSTDTDHHAALPPMTSPPAPKAAA